MDLDATQITEYLWQGSGNLQEWPAGFDAIVNLRREVDDLANIYVTAPAPPRVYLWMPVENGVFPGVVCLDGLVDMLLAMTVRKWRTLVHCLAGVSRSGLVCSAYLMRAAGLTAQAALLAVQQRRPVTVLHPVYWEGLLEYERFLAGRQ